MKIGKLDLNASIHIMQPWGIFLTSFSYSTQKSILSRQAQSPK